MDIDVVKSPSADEQDHAADRGPAIVDDKSIDAEETRILREVRFANEADRSTAAIARGEHTCSPAELLPQSMGEWNVVRKPSFEHLPFRNAQLSGLRRSQRASPPPRIRAATFAAASS